MYVSKIAAKKAETEVMMMGTIAGCCVMVVVVVEGTSSLVFEDEDVGRRSFV